MDWLSLVGNLASIVGLGVAIWTLIKVGTITTALRQQSRDRVLTDLIDKVSRIPRTKSELTDSTVTEVELVLRTIRLYYVSPIPLSRRSLKSLLRDLEEELRGAKRLGAVQHLLRLIRDEITIR